jgi:hypothetical protein
MFLSKQNQSKLELNLLFIKSEFIPLHASVIQKIEHYIIFVKKYQYNTNLKSQTFVFASFIINQDSLRYLSMQPFKFQLIQMII